MFIEAWFPQFSVEEFHFPAQTLELNPIQHIWDVSTHFDQLATFIEKALSLSFIRDYTKWFFFHELGVWRAFTTVVNIQLQQM